MSGELLVTKLFVPSMRAVLVQRPRLIEQIDQGVRAGRRVTHICAPAGFGKTTLVTQWLSHYGAAVLRSSSVGDRVGWLSLDEGDNDPSCFLTYLVGALQNIEADLGEAAAAMLQAPQPVPIDAVLTSIINDIAGLANVEPAMPAILVLDDYHHVSARAIHDAVAFLLESMPPSLHLVINGRSDPPLPLARLRARDQLTEIRQTDLRFNVAEAVAFLNDVMGLSLSTDEVQVLESRTEGWVAGLQLAAISMKGREDIPAFIHTFSGSHRFVMDYLAQEVLQQQEEEVRCFLEETVILGRFTAALCDTVTGRHDSYELLERLEHENLFIVPLDDDRQWFRYHRLFADLLRQRADSSVREGVPELHRRAAQWYEENGYVTDAITHWLAGNELAAAITLMEDNALGSLNRGEIFTVLGWLAELPPESVSTRPWLCIARAWSSLLSGQAAGIEADLLNAERVSLDAEFEADRQILLGHAAAIRAYLTLMMGDMSAAARHARDALQRLPEEDASTRGVVTYTLGGACLMKGDIEGACQAFAAAGSAGESAGNVHLAASALSALGLLQVQCGHLHRALNTFDRAQRLATGRSGRALPVAASAYNGKGLLFYERNDLEAAAGQLEKALKLATMWGNIDAQVSSHVLLARVQLARKDADSALALLHRADQLAQGKRITPTTAALLGAQWIRAWLTLGNRDRAARCAAERGLTVGDELTYVREVEFMALARLFIAQNDPEQAGYLLERLHRAAEVGGRMGHVIEILALRARNAQAQGHDDIAVAALKQALTLAREEGHVRAFLDAGPPLRSLFQRAIANDVVPDYAVKVLATFAPDSLLDSPMPDASAPGLAEPLTEHELKVLRLVAAGLSNREVAEELYLSVNTVKWHLKHLYEKLDVHSRVAAAARARELGLL